MIVPFRLQTGVFIYVDSKTLHRVFGSLEFDFIYPFKDRVSIVKHNNQYGVVNLNGELFIPLIYTCIVSFSEGHFLICLNSKYGIVDIRGRVIIPPIYENLSNVKNGLILFANKEDLYKDVAVNDDVKYGYLNLKNEIAIQPQFTPAEDFSEGLAVVGKYVGLDENYDSIIKYGYIDTTGKTIIDFQFEYAESFNNKIAFVMKENEKYHIDIKGRKIDNVVNPTRNESHYPIKFIKRHLVKTSFGDEGVIETFGYKDKSGRILIEPIYTYAEDFEDGLARVAVNNNTFYILIDGKELCERSISC